MRRTRDLAVSEVHYDLLRRLRTDYLDVLFLHNCDEPDDYEVVITGTGSWRSAFGSRARRATSASAATPATALRAVTSGAVEVLMFRSTCWSTRGRTALLSACVEHNVGVVAMKPYAGGKILQEHASAAVTPVACLSYALAQFGVATVVPGRPTWRSFATRSTTSMPLLPSATSRRHCGSWAPSGRHRRASTATTASLPGRHRHRRRHRASTWPGAAPGGCPPGLAPHPGLGLPAVWRLRLALPWHLDPPAAMTAAAALLE